MFLIISDLFYMNRLDPEYVSLQDSWEYGDFWIIFLYFSFIAYVLFGIPLLVFSLLQEFVCKTKVSRFAVAVVFGMAMGGFVAWTTTSSFTLLSPWHLAEAWAHFFACIGVMVLVVVAIDFRNATI